MGQGKEELIRIIKAKGIKETARLSGIPKSTIEKWVYGQSSPTLDLAEKVLDSLGQEILIFDKE